VIQAIDAPHWFEPDLASISGFRVGQIVNPPFRFRLAFAKTLEVIENVSDCLVHCTCEEVLEKTRTYGRTICDSIRR
jgi:hypothetical protein